MIEKIYIFTENINSVNVLGKLRHKFAEKLVGGSITKSAPSVFVSDTARLLLNGKPFYTDLSDSNALENEYNQNPVLSTVINLKADYASNAVISVRNIKNGEIITDKDFRDSKALDPIAKKMFTLKTNPNPLQSTKEFLALASIFKDVFGNSFTYGNSATGEINIKDVYFLWHVWPQFMKPNLTNRYFDQVAISGIINNWEWKHGGYSKTFGINEILHRKEANISLKKNDDYVLGVSRQKSIEWALSNIRISYESRNVIARERGMRAIISSDQSDGVAGSLPMDADEKTEVQNDLKTNYGFLSGQNQFMVTRHNINVHSIEQDIRKLGLIPEIQTDNIVVCHRYGVPKTLLDLISKGATFENQDTAERRMYQNTTIPEENDRWNDITNWLKCRDFGYEYIVSFDHIPVLQKNEKDKAETNKNISAQYESMFLRGACTYNRWLHAIGEPTEAWGNIRITEMSMEQIQKIKGNYTINNSLDTPNAE